MQIAQSILGFKEKKSAILERRNSLLKLLIIINIPNLIIIYLINRNVPNPYMDEPFHFDQFNHYFYNQYDYWNDKITTPPGLYWIQKLFSLVFGNSLLMVRSLNSLFFGNLFAVFVMKIYQFQDRNMNNLSRSLNIIITPSIYFFTFLDYTDSASISLIAITYYYNLVNSNYRLALCSLLTIYVRQNNILWIFYLMGYKFLTQYRKNLVVSGSFFKNLLNIIKIALNNKKAILEMFKFQIFVVLIFIGYIYKFNNGKLVFGDHTHHVLTFHPTQLLYLSLFIFLNIPISISQYWSNITSTLNSFYYSRHSFASYLFLLSICIVIVEKWTLVHPFILADNRHYIFYIYRLVFRPWYFRYSLCLVYPFLIIFMVRIVVSSQQKMSKLILWFIVSLAYLSVSQLVQPRYFAIPFLMYSLEIRNKNISIDIERIHMSEGLIKNIQKMLWSNLMKLIVNVIVLTIFLQYTFDGGVSRFMW